MTVDAHVRLAAEKRRAKRSRRRRDRPRSPGTENGCRGQNRSPRLNVALFRNTISPREPGKNRSLQPREAERTQKREIYHALCKFLRVPGNLNRFFLY